MNYKLTPKQRIIESTADWVLLKTAGFSSTESRSSDFFSKIHEMTAFCRNKYGLPAVYRNDNGDYFFEVDSKWFQYDRATFAFSTVGIAVQTKLLVDGFVEVVRKK